VTSRLALLERDEAPILARTWYRSDGSASALTRSLSAAPDVMETLMPFLGAIMDRSSIDLATKELVIMRVSQLNNCRYCLAAHRGAALESGVPESHLAAVCDQAPGESLPDRERAIIAWVDQVVLDASDVTDELVERMRDHLRDDQLIELTLLAGATTMLNQYCTAFAVPPPAVTA
jgi:AhpD family alkylhydroperoxidase